MDIITDSESVNTLYKHMTFTPCDFKYQVYIKLYLHLYMVVHKVFLQVAELLSGGTVFKRNG
jgi:hypothetical protein